LGGLLLEGGFVNGFWVNGSAFAGVGFTRGDSQLLKNRAFWFEVRKYFSLTRNLVKYKILQMVAMLGQTIP
jgi:hypothetical protein